MDRICANERNFYFVLRVKKDTPKVGRDPCAKRAAVPRRSHLTTPWQASALLSLLQAEVKANYYKLSRLVHPDKCSHPKAGDAAAVLNQVLLGLPACYCLWLGLAHSSRAAAATPAAAASRAGTCARGK